jgi:acyl-CoA synthetase (NDP forming)
VSGADPTIVQAGHLIQRVQAEGQTALLEWEGYALLTALGIAVPPWRFIARGDAIGEGDLEHLGDRVVVKVAGRAITHKTDRGGVQVVPANPDAVRGAVTAMAPRFPNDDVEGYLLAAFIAHAAELGGELLLSLRQTADFGPVVSVGFGGTRVEELARSLEPDDRVAMFGTEATEDAVIDRLRSLPATRAALGVARGTEPLVRAETLADLVLRLLRFGTSAAAARIAELEVNPLALTSQGPVALDAVVTLRTAPPVVTPPRPTDKLSRLLEPASVAIVGVSDGMNAGRLILRNVLREGFSPANLAVIKPGTDQIDGVRCYPSLAALPDPVDLCVLAVAAPQIPDLLGEIVDQRRAESVIVIPGGLGERAGSATLAEAARRHLDRSRDLPWHGPIVNGGNCLGIRSVPGRYDTTFIPRHKLGESGVRTAPLALISQSGAFAIARWSKLGGADPRYLISVGNQLDLTVGDYLEYLADDPQLTVFACYIEGFQPGDGRRWLEAARAIVASGRTVVLYRAGRTVEGRAAGASHTAAIAGDYAVTCELARAAGVIVADTLDEFDDVLRLATLLADRPVHGRRVGAVSNAGFECVAFGDGTGAMCLAELQASTLASVETLLERERLAGVVEARHPLDLTPIMGDVAFGDAVEAVLADPGVDIGVVGIVPLTGALRTLPAGPDHDERLDDPAGIVARLADLRARQHTPFVAVVDAGAAYDPLAAALEAARIPTFRTVDRAMRALARVTEGLAGEGSPAYVPALAGAAT